MIPDRVHLFKCTEMKFSFMNKFDFVKKMFGKEESFPRKPNINDEQR